MKQEFEIVQTQHSQFLYNLNQFQNHKIMLAPVSLCIFIED